MADQSENTGIDDAVDMKDEELKLTMAVLKVLNPGLKAADVPEKLAEVAAKHGLDEAYTKKWFDQIQDSYAEYKRTEPPKEIKILSRKSRGKRAGSSQDDDEDTKDSATSQSFPVTGHTATPAHRAPLVPHVSRRSQTTARSVRASARAARDEVQNSGENSSPAAPSPVGTQTNQNVPVHSNAPKRKRDSSTTPTVKRHKPDIEGDDSGDENQRE
ncbi:hypothetical protein PG996_005128 [Apiospora saccharicola]|uniref:Uncharacterized protein n=1 Tax=Apiospora saccharicola TaxID=335842 RepID=A0ABR1VNJ9_9PEZI